MAIEPTTYQDALAEHGSKAEAARQLGIPVTTFKSRLGAELAGRPVYIVTGRSTLRNRDGEVVAEWTKESLDQKRAEEARQAALEAMLDTLPRYAAVKPPKAVNDDLCNFFTFTDYHLGMLAWHKEGGQDWDLAIAENTLLAALAAMIAQSPKAHTAVINIQGDFLHTDGMIPVTPGHGHVLDADSRFPKIRKAAIRLIRHMVRMTLESHAAVRLIIAEGNHDEESSGWLADAFGVVYEDEPRISVDDSALPFYVFQWGKTMLGVHHGHKVKNESLPLLFAAQFPEMWGLTRKREIHCGHRHHRDEKEYNGVTVIQHPTLAARDAYAARGGWIADRAAQSITYHKEYGQVGRVSVCPEMLAA